MMMLSEMLRQLTVAMEKNGDVPVGVQDVSGVQHSMIGVVFNYGAGEPVTIETYLVRSSAKTIEAQKNIENLSGEHHGYNEIRERLPNRFLSRNPAENSLPKRGPSVVVGSALDEMDYAGRPVTNRAPTKTPRENREEEILRGMQKAYGRTLIPPDPE